MIVELNTELLRVSNSLYLIDEAVRRILLDDGIKLKSEALTAYLTMLTQVDKAFKHASEACSQLGLALRSGGPDSVEFDLLHRPTADMPTEADIAAMVEEAARGGDVEPPPPKPRQTGKSHHHHGAFNADVCQPRDNSKCSGELYHINCDVPGCKWYCTKCKKHNKRPAQTLAMHRRKEHGKRSTHDE